MELLKAVLLGLVQGATEFLPVSSSGHLVLGSQLLNFHDQGMLFNVTVHVGTLVSVVIVFRAELYQMVLAPFRWLAGDRTEGTRYFLEWNRYVLLATIPAALVGVFLKYYSRSIFNSSLLVCMMLAFTGVMMVMTRYLPQRKVRLRSGQAVLIGIAQACAIIPGLSRSGTTIFAGMLLGIDRETVARFSFIMSIPAIIGAALLGIGEALDSPPEAASLINLGCGTVTAAIAGYFAINLLLDVVKNNRLQWFGYYCLVVSVGGMLLIYFW